MSDIVERLRATSWANQSGSLKSLDDEAAAHIEALERKVEVARVALGAIQSEAERPSGRWQHLKRVIGTRARQALKEIENDTPE